MRRIYFCLSAFVLISAQAMDFQQAYERLLAQNGEYQAQLKNYKASKAQVWVERAALFPQLNVSGRYGRVAQEITDFEQRFANSNNRPASLVRDGHFETSGATVNLQQTLFDAQKITALWRSKSQKKEAKYALSQTREELILQLVVAYMGYLNATELLAITKKELSTLNEHYDLTQRRFDEGLGTLTDVYESESRYQLAQADFLQSDFDQKRFANDLAVLLHGRDIIGYVLRKKIGLNIPEDAVINPLLVNDVLLAKQRVKTAKFTRNNARASVLPTLNVVGRADITGEEFSEVSLQDENRRAEILLQLEVPLFTGFANTSSWRSAQHSYRAAQNLLKNSIQRAIFNHHSAEDNFFNAKQRLALLQKSYLASQKALKLRKEGFVEGLSNNIDLLDAVRNSYSAERAYRTAVYEYFQRYFEYIASYREISLADVRYLNQQLVPKSL